VAQAVDISLIAGKQQVASFILPVPASERQLVVISGQLKPPFNPYITLYQYQDKKFQRYYKKN
jgi:hypothetical protein